MLYGNIKTNRSKKKLSTGLFLFSAKNMMANCMSTGFKIPILNTLYVIVF